MKIILLWPRLHPAQSTRAYGASLVNWEGVPFPSHKHGKNNVRRS